MCIIAFIVHTSVAIVVINMQCIQVVPALPTNEVSTANEDSMSHVHLYVSAASAILNFSGLLWQVVNSRLSNNDNRRQISKFECALQQLVAGNSINAQRELLQFHRQCFGNATAQYCDIYQNLHTLFSGRFVIGQIDTGKALNQLTYLTALCSIAW